MRTRTLAPLVSLVIGIVLCSLLAPFGCGSPSGKQTEARLRSAVQNDPHDADARIELAGLLDERGARAEAVVTLQEGLKLDPNNVRLVKSLAQAYTRWGDENDSPKKYEVAAGYWQQVVDSGGVDAETIKLLGYVQRRAGQYAKAIDSFATALRLEPQDAYSLSQLGFAYKASGKYEKALSALTAAAEQSPQDYLIWWWLGDAQRLLGDYESALASMKKAFEFSPRDKRAELQEYVQFTQGLLLGPASRRGSSYHRVLADRHENTGRPDRAIAEYKKTLELLPPEAYEMIAWCNGQILYCYSETNQMEKAIEHAERAIENYKKAGIPFALSQMYQALASVYRKLANMEEGTRRKEFLEKSLAAREMEEHYALEADNLHMAMHALADKVSPMAELYGVDDPRVKECREAMAQYLPEKGPVTDCAIASVIDSEAHLRVLEKDYAGAKELYGMVEPYYGGETKDFTVLVVAPGIYNHLSFISWKQGNLDEAIMYGEKAAAKLSQMRSLLGLDRFRRSVGGSTWRYVFANRLVRMALEMGDKTRAFNYAEQYKGRALVDLLGTKAAATKRRAFDEKRMEKGVVLARVQGVERKVEKAKSGRDADGLRSLQRTLSIEKTKYERLAEDVSVAELEIRNFEDVESMTTEVLQPIADQFTVVSYVVDRDWGTCATVLSKEQVEGAALEGISEERLRPLVEAFRREIGVKSSVSRDLALEVEEKEQAPEKPEKAASEELYELLIEPVLPYIKTKLVYISPDSVLNYLPFEALQKDGRYLIEDYSIAYAPSASVLKICMDRNRNRRESVLALGNPNLKNPAFRLVHAENEVNSLEGLFPKVDVYAGDDATEAVVQQHGGEYDILHFACHGELNLDEPMLTSLRLAPDSENDGYLHAGEVFDYDLSASLVVLSACNSALGELTSGNELMGLTRSFLYAGVPSIVASLWTVDDRSTSYLMQHFYKNLATMNKADALREAKLETMKKYPGPFHWAAFCLQGDYR